MDIQHLFTFDLGIRSPELDVAVIYAKRAFGLDPHPRFGSGFSSSYRELAMAKYEVPEGEEIGILCSTPTIRVREGFISRGFWQSGTAEDHEGSRTVRHPIRDDLGYLSLLKLNAEQREASCIEIDEDEAGRLNKLGYDHVEWCLDPRRAQDSGFHGRIGWKEAKQLLDSCQRQLHYESDQSRTFVWLNPNDRNRWVAFGRIGSNVDPVIVVLHNYKTGRDTETRFTRKAALALGQFVTA